MVENTSGVYSNEQIEYYKLKVNRAVAKAEQFKDKAIKFKQSLEKDADEMKKCIDTLKASYPILPPAKDINTVDGYIKLKAAITKLDKIIAEAQNDDNYKVLSSLVALNENTEKTLKEVMGMLEDIMKTPEFAEYIKNGIA